MAYPTELIEKAKYEMKVFERVSADTGNQLIEEVERLRKGEYICKCCGLRKNDDHPKPDF